MRLTDAEVESLHQSLSPTARILLIIHATLLVGVMGYFAFSWSQGLSLGGNDKPPPILPLALALLNSVMSFVLPSVIRSSARVDQESDLQPLAGAYQVAHIVGMAFLEGACFFAIFSLSNNRQNPPPAWFLCVPVFLIVLMLARTPLPRSLTNWVVGKLEERGSQ
jgi:hypothetical protein